MKKSIVVLSAFLCLLISCKEEPVYIPPLGKGSGTVDPKTTSRNVLVEEFTGVKCVNCPDGAAEIQNLKDKYGERLFAVSIHAGFFSKKLAESKYDFKIAKGVSLLTFLGEPDGYPAVVINRKPLGTNGNLVVVGQAKWAGLVQQEANEQVVAKVELTNNFNEANRELKVTVNITALEAISGEHHLSLLLTEDNIVDAQTVPLKGVVTDYNHKHVLRDMLTNYDGLLLTEALSKNTTIKKEFTYSVPANFKAKDCEIIAVLHKAGASKEVVQVTGEKVQ